MTIKTVGQLIDCLEKYDKDCRLDICVSWYDRHNYNCAHRDFWDHPKGIPLYVSEEDGIVTIANDDAKDIYVYED